MSRAEEDTYGRNGKSEVVNPYVYFRWVRDSMFHTEFLFIFRFQESITRIPSIHTVNSNRTLTQNQKKNKKKFKRNQRHHFQINVLLLLRRDIQSDVIDFFCLCDEDYTIAVSPQPPPPLCIKWTSFAMQHCWTGNNRRATLKSNTKKKKEIHQLTDSESSLSALIILSVVYFAG